MLSDDPSKLAAPRRAREAWEQIESIAATTLVQTIHAVVSAHTKAFEGRPDPLVAGERLEAVLAGLVQAYALAMVESGVVVDQEAQERIMSRGLMMAELRRGEHGRPNEGLEGLLIEKFSR